MRSLIAIFLLGLFCVTSHALTCYECDSSAGDKTCLENVVRPSWKTNECSSRVPELDLEINPRAVRCVHMTYIEDGVYHKERKCGFQGLCELLYQLNETRVLGNVSQIECHTCNSTLCNHYGDPKQINFQNNNNL